MALDVGGEITLRIGNAGTFGNDWEAVVNQDLTGSHALSGSQKHPSAVLLYFYAKIKKFLGSYVLAINRKVLRSM